MDKTNLFSIVNIAKLFSLSVGSLRHYENLGILKPEYIDEKTGTIVTIYDPDITVEFPEIMPYSSNAVVVDGRIYVKKGSTENVGGATDSFEATKNGTVYFTLSDFQYSEYNVSLNKKGVTDSPLVVLENKAIDVPVALKGVKNGVSYEFRVSSWLGAGGATYEATM